MARNMVIYFHGRGKKKQEVSENPSRTSPQGCAHVKKGRKALRSRWNLRGEQAEHLALVSSMEVWGGKGAGRSRARRAQVRIPPQELAAGLKKFQAAMVTAGVPVWRARRVWVAMRSWQSASRRAVLRVLDLDWFRSLGLVFLQD